tara:strand:+ start:692 stop:1198 length:507 start_codon:yes stop_codon:yes gene_type:complete
MFILNGKPLALDVAFTTGGYQYPANWMRQATLAQKNAIGITEVADPPWYDGRFYWGVGKPKDIADLKTLWIDKQKLTASSLLSKTDWMIIRKQEAGTAVPSATTTYRTAVRTQCKAREDQITACSTTDELADLISDGKRQGTEKKDSDGKSFDPKQYNEIVLEAWPSE